jgi:hypothetical protein
MSRVDLVGARALKTVFDEPLPLLWFSFSGLEVKSKPFFALCHKAVEINLQDLLIHHLYCFK